MSRQKKVQLWKAFRYLLVSVLLPVSIFAYDGSETWLHYSPVPDELKAGYDAACQSLVISDAASDTLKNAKAEIDLGMKGLLSKTLTVGTSVAAGAIVLAPEGSPLVASAGIDYGAINKEGFIIKSAGGATYITGKTQVGVLRGTFAFLRQMQLGKSISNLDIKESPYFAYRVLDHWYHHYGSTGDKVERLYGGNRVFKMESFGSLNQEGADRTRVINYCRMAASLGINGVTPDCVNTVTMGSANWQVLQEDNLKTQKVFADIIGTWGLKYFLTVSYNSPKLIGGISSDPRLPATVTWWEDRVKMVVKYCANFGGFLMKADSEDETGPLSVFNSDQASGSSPLADALGKYGVLIWRTFIYTKSKADDFAVTQMKTFSGKTWNKNVILRMKDGPRDFQVVEPPNFISTLGGVRLGMELQVTQEYTGQDKHVNWMVPRWKQVFDWNMVGANIRDGVKGTKMHQILAGDNTYENGGGLWGISNLSDAKNWTGHYLHQANAYGYGRLAWNPLLSADQIADEWIRCSFTGGNNPAVQFVVNDILKKSWKTYEDYTISYSALMPAVGNNLHYDIDFDNMDGAGFLTPFFMNLASDGIGVNRNTKTDGSFLSYLPKALADSLGNIATCPEDYLLFFHHCIWEYKMKSGMTLIQSLHYNHLRGIRQVKRFINNWKLLSGKIDSEIYSHVLGKLQSNQLADASKWANTFKTQFGKRYSKAVGCDLEIVVPDASKAVTLVTGDSVDLSSKFADQNGTALTEAINWSVSDGGTLDATTGTKVKFSAAANGVYEVTASLASIPDLKDKIQIFVGDWWNPPVGVKKAASIALAKAVIRFNYTPHTVVISTPFEGNLDVIGLNGRVVKSIAVPRAGRVELNTSVLGGGLYLVRLKGLQQELKSKLLVR
jgi:alpha-glucuronidase